MSSIITLAQYNAFATRHGLSTLTEEEAATPLAEASAEAFTLSGREWIPTPAETTAARTFRGNGRRILYIDDALSIASVVVNGAPVTDHTAIAVETATPIIALERASGYLWGAGLAVVVTGRWGYCEAAALPVDVVEAVATLAAIRAVGDALAWDAVTSTDDAKISVLNVTIDNAKGASTSADAIDKLQAKAERVLRGYRRVMSA